MSRYSAYSGFERFGEDKEDCFKSKEGLYPYQLMELAFIGRQYPPAWDEFCKYYQLDYEKELEALRRHGFLDGFSLTDKAIEELNDNSYITLLLMLPVVSPESLNRMIHEAEDSDGICLMVLKLLEGEAEGYMENNYYSSLMECMYRAANFCIELGMYDLAPRYIGKLAKLEVSGLDNEYASYCDDKERVKEEFEEKSAHSKTFEGSKLYRVSDDTKKLLSDASEHLSAKDLVGGMVTGMKELQLPHSLFKDVEIQNILIGLMEDKPDIIHYIYGKAYKRRSN